MEKLRWAEKEWRELDQEMASASDGAEEASDEQADAVDDEEAELAGLADSMTVAS